MAVGLISVPIKVHSATEDKSVHFHQVHAKDGARIKQKRICSKEGREVPYDEVAKGYEVRRGVSVLISQDEINAAAGGRSRQVSLEEFILSQEIDPVFYDRTYYLGAGDGGEDAYRLLHDALARTRRAGLGRWVFHNREYLVAVRAKDDVLILHTMRFAEELVDPGRLEVPAPSRAPTKREVEMAGQLVETLHGRFRPGAFKDAYRDRVLGLIARKARGQKIDLAEPQQPDETPDLMSALEASLEKGRTSKRGPKSGARTGRKAKA